MRGLAFRLEGKTAFFKKPEVNSYVYMTYNNIHKVALLGLLGAIIGLDGYYEQYVYNKNNTSKLAYPEFYEKLNPLKVAIVPLSEKGSFTKKLQTFNNSVGYASKEEGGNLIVNEYWLEHPRWEIYLLSENEALIDDIGQYILNNQTVYTPYLGKNDHLADINNSRTVEINPAKTINQVNSLVPLKLIQCSNSRRGQANNAFLSKEALPYKMTPELNMYENEIFAFTNQKIESVKETTSFYEADNKVLYMF
ncbi:CRISPR-associated protein Cas5h [Natranaerovirga hydrolytica]|uniref:CRISPR-associated protein Cas5h n=1 Tax=Natranaerovirga hydrolytica TaxID=680378 RepID=A0A4R1MZP8_9FIRM|nr:type I-B CRISPR-associated protein Cas5b [Natranaerovirga hydrolytica]TCK98665.1 CRISPR-associated protein Cas5h [Natranaerovirga hydrolytica]